MYRFNCARVSMRCWVDAAYASGPNGRRCTTVDDSTPVSFQQDFNPDSNDLLISQSLTWKEVGMCSFSPSNGGG